jgi:hypothetical protein
MAELLKIIKESSKDKCPRTCICVSFRKCENCLSYEYCIEECTALLNDSCKYEDACKSVVKMECLRRYIL